MSQLVTGALTFRIRGPKDRSQAVDGAPLLVPIEVGEPIDARVSSAKFDVQA
jgi:hypothetical protein